MSPDFPYRIAHLGTTATAERSEHLRDLIEQVLFTAPGERVNRPGFGSGLRQLTFEPNNAELAATVRFLVNGALQQWLGDLIEVLSVDLAVADSRLDITIKYRDLLASRRGEASFQQTF